MSQKPHATESILGNAPLIEALRAQIRRLASFDTPGNVHVPTVLLHGESGTEQFCVISLKKTNPADATVPWKALNGAVALDPGYLKWVIVVDDDIDPHDPDSYLWALCWRVQPDRDIRITPGKSAHLDPSAVPPDETSQMTVYPPTTSIPRLAPRCPGSAIRLVTGLQTIKRKLKSR